MPRPKSDSRNRDAIEFARFERKTANEFSRAMWNALRNRKRRGFKFRREYSIPPYTADFCCVELKLIVEVDGESHFTDQGQRYDLTRDQFLNRLGYHVVRIPGYDVLNDMPTVMRKIESSIELVADQSSNPK